MHHFHSSFFTPSSLALRESWYPTVPLLETMEFSLSLLRQAGCSLEEADLSSRWTGRSSKKDISDLILIHTPWCLQKGMSAQRQQESIGLRRPQVLCGHSKTVLTRRRICIFAWLHGLLYVTLQFAEFNTVEMWHYNLLVERPRNSNVQAPWTQAELKLSCQWGWFLQLLFLTFPWYLFFSFFASIFLASHFLYYYHQAWKSN